jgi:hypothetical protein
MCHLFHPQYITNIILFFTVSAVPTLQQNPMVNFPIDIPIVPDLADW